MGWVEIFFWAVFIALSAIITLIDAKSYRIPNKLVLILGAVGLCAVVILWRENFGAHLIAAIVTLVIGYLLYQFTGFGAGDAKYFAAIMLWFGPGGALLLLYWFGVFCAVLVVILIIGRRLSDRAKFGLKNWRPMQKDAPVPLALAIGPAAIVSCLMLANGFAL